jgi:hypothetical protein
MARPGTFVALAGALLALAGALSSVPASAQLVQGGPNAFMLVALGDMPYKLPDDTAKVDRMIAAINRVRPAFSIHVGDIKSGGTPCTDEILTRSLVQMQQLEQPLVYTPGDNEWTDCHRESAGRFDPRERLAKVRELFFPKPGLTLGKAPRTVETQARLDPKHAAFVENQRFMHNGVVIATAHVVGSNNGFEPHDPAAATEFFARNAANIAWLGDSFRVAKETGAKAMIVAFQADLFDISQKYPAMPRASAFTDTVKAIEAGAKAFGKPVLVIHGDAHELELQGFRDTRMKLVPNVLRLQVMGAERVHAVRVLVDPDDPAVFGILPLVVPENGPM